ncbi:MAG: TRAM domain-containing protein, partial [Gammaproteobacteria bacterium]
MRRHRRAGSGAAPRAASAQSGPLTLTPRKLVAGGAALATAADGRVVFVAGALPGETVRARVMASSRDFLRARVDTIESASDDRVAPPCPEVARGCGGCDWMHIAPAAQVAFKAAIVADALARTAGISHVPVTPGMRVAPSAYRTTLRLALDRSGRPAFRGAGSHRLVTVSACQVAHPALSALLPALTIVGAREVQLRVSAATGARSARWWPPEAHASGLPDDVSRGPDSVLTEVVNGVALRVSADAFFQS